MSTTAIAAPNSAPSNPLLSATLVMGLVLMSIFMLMAGKSVLVPLAMAILLWFIINALANRLDKLTALIPVSEELMEDAPAMDGYLRRKVVDVFTFKVNRAIIRFAKRIRR